MIFLKYFDHYKGFGKFQSLIFANLPKNDFTKNLRSRKMNKPQCIFDTFINGKTPKKGTQGGPGGKLSGTPWYFKYLKMT